MYQEELSTNVHVFVSEDNTWNWKQHPDDLETRQPFITYIGGNNYQKLDKIIADLPYSVRAIRRDAKHFKKVFTYELKIWGLAWSDAHLIAEALERKEQPQLKATA